MAMPTLAGRRAGQELIERDQVDIGLLVEPFAARDEFLAEIAEMRDRAAEAGHAEAQKRDQHFGGIAVMPVYGGGGGWISLISLQNIVFYAAVVDKSGLYR